MGGRGRPGIPSTLFCPLSGFSTDLSFPPTLALLPLDRPRLVRGKEKGKKRGKKGGRGRSPPRAKREEREGEERGGEEKKDLMTLLLL